MISQTPLPTLASAALELRANVGDRFFRAEADRLARVCHTMAGRFSRGGRLLACALQPADRSDARHVAVEFVHPVIVGKRALSALALTGDGASLHAQIDLLVEPNDIVMTFGDHNDLRPVINLARERGALTLAFASLGAEAEFVPPTIESCIRQELIETLYHVLWELVHVFFEHRGLLENRPPGTVHDGGASGFLYPFLTEAERGLDDVLADVRASILMKAEEAMNLRRSTVQDSERALTAAAEALRRAFSDGGRVLAFGNGGSATDAMDAVADLLFPPHGWSRQPALDLTEDPAILSAIGNDIGHDAVFARQIIAYGRKADVALAFSTSGDSRNIIAALEEARRRGLYTVAFVGYEGGRIAADRLADAVIIAPSEHIPRIQEAHATAWHLLRDRLEQMLRDRLDQR